MARELTSILVDYGSLKPKKPKKRLKQKGAIKDREKDRSLRREGHKG